MEGRVLLSATVYTVNLLSDTDTSDGIDPNTGTPAGDLLWAVTQANSNTNTAGSLIMFDPRVFANLQTIDLSSTLTLEETDGPEAIDGPEVEVAISGKNAVGVFDVEYGVTASFAGLIITGGGGQYRAGGIYNDGTLTVATCTIDENSASGAGGGILNENGGNLIVNGSSVYDNSAGQFGGGIYSDGMLDVTGSYIADNSAEFGGGIDSDGTATITASTITGNTASAGGAIGNSGTLNLTGSTIGPNNSAVNGGGIDSDGTATITGSTIQANSARRRRHLWREPV